MKTSFWFGRVVSLCAFSLVPCLAADAVPDATLKDVRMALFCHIDGEARLLLFKGLRRAEKKPMSDLETEAAPAFGAPIRVTPAPVDLDENLPPFAKLRIGRMIAPSTLAETEVIRQIEIVPIRDGKATLDGASAVIWASADFDTAYSASGPLPDTAIPCEAVYGVGRGPDQAVYLLGVPEFWPREVSPKPNAVFKLVVLRARKACTAELFGQHDFTSSTAGGNPFVKRIGRETRVAGFGVTEDSNIVAVVTTDGSFVPFDTVKMTYGEIALLVEGRVLAVATHGEITSVVWLGEDGMTRASRFEKMVQTGKPAIISTKRSFLKVSACMENENVLYLVVLFPSQTGGSRLLFTWTNLSSEDKDVEWKEVRKLQGGAGMELSTAIVLVEGSKRLQVAISDLATNSVTLHSLPLPKKTSKAVEAQEPVDADFPPKSTGNEGLHEVQGRDEGK